MGGEPVVHLELAIAVMFGSALVNVIVGRRLHRVARRTGSPAIEGDALHLSADVWTSAGTGVGLVLVLITGWEPLDSIVALAVAAYVTWMGAALTHRAARELTDHTLPDEELARIDAVLARSGGAGVSFHAIRARRAGSKRHIDLHMVVPPETTVRDGHAMSGRLKAELREAIPNADVLIHLEDH